VSGIREEGGPAGLRAPRVPEGARRHRITGSLIYGFLHCEHSVHLAFFGDPDRRLPLSEEEKWLRERGRRHEARVVASLKGVAEPEYPARDFEAGAIATRKLLAEGRPFVSQGVLLREPFLGIPDLLRRVEGESRLGSFHYEVGDIKSSYAARSGQAMQVVFYSRLLAEIQGRTPERGFLILREGEEESVPIRELDSVLEEILEEMDRWLLAPSGSRPHRDYACAGCEWRAVCGSRADLYWIPGLTRAEREVFAELGYEEAEALCWADPRRLGRRGRLPESTWARARHHALALREGRPVPTHPPRVEDLVGELRFAVVLEDAFDRRFPFFAIARPGGESFEGFEAPDPGSEVAALEALCRASGDRGPLVHGGELPRVLYSFAVRHPSLAPLVRRLEGRWVDLMSLVRGAYAFPEPVRHPGRALALFGPGSGGEGAWDPDGDSVALRLKEGDSKGLRALARRRLETLEALVSVLRAHPGRRKTAAAEKAGRAAAERRLEAGA